MAHVFMTFGGPSVQYHEAVKRICKQAEKFKIFDRIHGFTEQDLINDPDIWSQHGEFILTRPRGFGYWIWKSLLIFKVMSGLKEGDIVVYADSGCELNFQGKPRMLEYLDMVRENDILGFQMHHLEKAYTKMDLLRYFSCTAEEINTGQVMATVQIMRKCERTMRILNEIISTSTAMNYHFIDDTPSLHANAPEYIDHRHDQSIYSILIKRYGYYIPDETYHSPDWTKGMKYPILAMRNKAGVSLLPWTT